MGNLTEDQIGAEAVAIANEIETVLDGRSMAAAFIAIGMVLGHAASRATRPDLDGLMRHIRNVAALEMARPPHG